MRPLIIILLLFGSMSSNGSAPGPARIFIQYSENEEYYFRSTPYGRSPGDVGKTEVYTADHKILYTIKKYRTGFLSDDGRYFVSFKPRIQRNTGLQQDLVNIWKDGKPYRSILTCDLIKDTGRLKWGLPGMHTGVSTATWYRRTFVHNDSLYLLTTEGNAAIIDIAAGKIVSLEDKEVVLNRFKAAAPKEKQANIPISQPTFFGWGIPPLSDGRHFRRSIVKALELDTLTEYKKGCIDVTFSILLSGDGSAVLHNWFTYGEKGLEIDALKEKFKAWIAAQNFSSSAIPKECEQWLFEDYFYLNKL